MKTLLRIKHCFQGHPICIDYDEKYLYCECGKKWEHYNREIIKDWIFPYIDKNK